ncbi:MAG: autotransporter outer membrane beta-barrel domain-containing protein, partial [Alphaproteobacteria bacterium]|nr:autotransporter outer membrane beta-barrel domain-containing protein [Alphaproteobacteria bacterium]
NIYVKPGVIQRMYAGGKLDVEGLESLHTLEDRTIGRVAVGAEAQLNTRWNIGGAVAYGFGSDYEDTSLNLDMKYKW